MACDDDAITRLFSDYRGDGWHFRFTAPQVDGITYDLATLLVQIRSTTGELIASTGTDGAADGVIQLETTGSNFTSDPMIFEVTASGDTGTVNPDGLYVLEAQCEINGRVDTFLHHQWIVSRDYAYAEGGS